MGDNCFDTLDLFTIVVSFDGKTTNTGSDSINLHASY
jgi:hypothetical protein